MHAQTAHMLTHMHINAHTNPQLQWLPVNTPASVVYMVLPIEQMLWNLRCRSTPPPPPHPTYTHTHTYIYTRTHTHTLTVSLPPSWPCHERAMWRSIPPGTSTLAVPTLPRLAAANWKDQENSRLKVDCFFVCLEVCVCT